MPSSETLSRIAARLTNLHPRSTPIRFQSGCPMSRTATSGQQSQPRAGPTWSAITRSPTCVKTNAWPTEHVQDGDHVRRLAIQHEEGDQQAVHPSVHADLPAPPTVLYANPALIAPVDRPPASHAAPAPGNSQSRGLRRQFLDGMVYRIIEIEDFRLHECEGKLLGKSALEAVAAGDAPRRLADIKKRQAPRPIDQIITGIYDGLRVSTDLLTVTGLEGLQRHAAVRGALLRPAARRPGRGARLERVRQVDAAGRADR